MLRCACLDLCVCLQTDPYLLEIGRLQYRPHSYFSAQMPACCADVSPCQLSMAKHGDCLACPLYACSNPFCVYNEMYMSQLHPMYCSRVSSESWDLTTAAELDSLPASETQINAAVKQSVHFYLMP